MDNKDFYITLPSDASKDIYPNNEPGEFTVKLPRPITLNGQWEVGLQDIACTKWKHIQLNGEPIQYTENGTVKKTNKLKENYERLQDYIKDINDSFPVKNKITFGLSNHKVTVTLESGYAVKLRKEQAIVLGFLPFDTSDEIKEITSTSTGTYKANLYRDTNIYIYCSIVQPQILGDQTVPLLDMVRSKGHRHLPVRYIPVLIKSFQEIQILLRSSTNELISFDRGRAVITLHFRRIKLF